MLTKSRILNVRRIPLWANQPLKTAWIARCGSRETKIATIEWDPAETELIRATLVIPNLTSEECTDAIIWVNNELVKKYTWGRGEGGTVEDALDVKSLIHSGTNKVTAQLCDTWCSTRLRPAHASITAYLEYDFTGEEPDTDGDPWELFKEWMKKNWWVTIPIVALAVITVPRRKR